MPSNSKQRYEPGNDQFRRVPMFTCTHKNRHEPTQIFSAWKHIVPQTSNVGSAVSIDHPDVQRSPDVDADLQLSSYLMFDIGRTLDSRLQHICRTTSLGRQTSSNIQGTSVEDHRHSQNQHWTSEGRWMSNGQQRPWHIRKRPSTSAEPALDIPKTLNNWCPTHVFGTICSTPGFWLWQISAAVGCFPSSSLSGFANTLQVKKSHKCCDQSYDQRGVKKEAKVPPVAPKTITSSLCKSTGKPHTCGAHKRQCVA